jgi:hypothetical protein
MLIAGSGDRRKRDTTIAPTTDPNVDTDTDLAFAIDALAAKSPSSFHAGQRTSQHQNSTPGDPLRHRV